MIGIVNWIAFLITVLVVSVNPPQSAPISGTEFAIVTIAALALSGLMMFGASKMRQMESWWLAVTGSVLAMIVSPGNIVGLPVGIWALSLLTRKEIKTAFADAEKG